MDVAFVNSMMPSIDNAANELLRDKLCVVEDGYSPGFSGMMKIVRQVQLAARAYIVAGTPLAMRAQLDRVLKAGPELDRYAAELAYYPDTVQKIDTLRQLIAKVAPAAGRARKVKARDRISLEIPKALRSRIEAQCVARSETISVFVRKAIAERIKRLEGSPCDT